MARQYTIVAGVITAALQADGDSYLSVDPNWVPTLPGPRNPEMFKMVHLLRFVIDHSQPPPDPALVLGS